MDEVASNGAPAAPPEARPAHGSYVVTATLNVNGTEQMLTLDPRVSLLDALRDHLQLTGSKKGCNQGACGACTVLLDGERVLSCLTLAVQCDGHRVTTIEGMAADATGHALQQAFMDDDAFQCGYCTPGQIMSAIACVNEGHAASDGAIREYMSGNICRCGAYPNIVAAIEEVMLDAAAARSGEAER